MFRSSNTRYDQKQMSPHHFRRRGVCKNNDIRAIGVINKTRAARGCWVRSEALLGLLGSPLPQMQTAEVAKWL